MNLELLKCNINSSIRDAISLINKNAKGTVFVVDEFDKLLGVLTDGDIRRSLLDGGGLNTPLENIIKKDFVYAKEKEDKYSVVAKLSPKIRIIPIVNDDMKVVSYTEFDTEKKISLAIPQLNKNEYKYLMNAFLTTWISSAGEYICKFEDSFAEYCNMKYGIATSNGTTALHLALLALGIGPGDEVIVPDLTFAATINAVIYTGATPVIVDIEHDGWCIDPEGVENAISDKTKAIIPVHLYGQPCDMGKLCDIAKKHNLYLVEDCAEAHGAEWNGKKIGSFGDVSCFSFYGNKVITTGEGGMCLTNSAELESKMKILRDHGMSKDRRYYHEVIGYNYRMTNMQAAIGTAQVEHIDDILEWRTKLEDLYRSIFKDDDRIKLQPNNLIGRKKITWLVSVLVDEQKREVLIEAFRNNNIDVRAFFVPLSEMDIYKKYVHGDCIVSERISKQGINLPTTYEINEEKVRRIYNIASDILN